MMMKEMVPTNYKTDNIIAWYDGIQNVGENQHSNSSDNWIDLTSNHNNIVLTRSSWDENSLYIEHDVHGTFTSKFKPVVEEIVIKIDEATSSYGECPVVCKLNGVGFYILHFSTSLYLYFTDNYNNINRNIRYYTTSPLKMGDKICVQVVIGEIQANNNAYGWKCFINGIERTVRYVDAGINVDDYDINGRTDKYFKGHIYSMRFHNAVLSDKELKNNYKLDKKRFKI